MILDNVGKVAYFFGIPIKSKWRDRFKSFVEECVEGVIRLMQSDFSGPVNIGSDEMVTINQLVNIVCEIAQKNPTKKHIPGPLGVRGRNSDNRLIKRNWVGAEVSLLKTVWRRHINGYTMS